MNITSYFKILVCGFICVTYGLFASEDLKEEMLDHLGFIKRTFEIKYAPADWKKESLGWDLDENYIKARQKIENLSNPKLKDFHKILREVFFSAADYHVNVFFHSTEASFLPFKVYGAQGRYFLSWIDREKLELPEWSEGDEILFFDEKPIHQLLEEIRLSDWNRQNEMTDSRMAQKSLTTRISLLGHDVPQGNVSVLIKHQSTGEEKQYQLTWDYFPESIKEIEGPKPKAMSRSRSPLSQKEMITPYYALFKKADKIYHSSDDKREIGSRDSFVPPLGKIVWESSEENIFNAHIAELPNRIKVGYVRIPEFIGDDEEVEEFASLIERFQRQTHALIVDQVNNPGGMVFYKYALLSMLTDKTLELPTFRMTLTQEEVMHAFETLELLDLIENDDDAVEILGETWQGYPITYDEAQSIKEYCQSILTEWGAGKHFTDPIHLVFNKIVPSKIANYTKPLVVLTNELCFSCADSFPAILQDNHRAIIFGAKTAGAGGVVQSTSYPNLMGIAGYSYTSAILERQSKRPIENVGVEPDVAYTLTFDDHRNGYKGYREALKKVVEDAILNSRTVRR